jgi:hypothetical protein
MALGLHAVPLVYNSDRNFSNFVVLIVNSSGIKLLKIRTCITVLVN